VGEGVGGTIGVKAVVGDMVLVGSEEHSHFAAVPCPSKKRICLGRMPPEKRQTRAPFHFPDEDRVSHFAT